MLVATHDGNFHADDAFAVAALELAHGPVDIVRTRDPQRLAAADARVDVGGRHDPQSGDFDHHQRGGAGERPNGIRYASFGLVWREVGEHLSGSAESAASIDERLVQGVDANDTGQTIIETLVDGIRPMTVSGVVAALNPAWDEQLDPEEVDTRFAEAVALARRVLEREIAAAAAYRRARRLVESAIEQAGGGPVIELQRNMPWREVVVAGAPAARFVVYPKGGDGWGLQAVPAELGTFANRVDLPEAWAGLSDEALVAASGIPGARFCHPSRFYAAAEHREAILEIARRALAEAGEA